MFDVVDIDIANIIKQDALSIIQSQYNRKSTGEQLKVNKKKNGGKRSFLLHNFLFTFCCNSQFSYKFTLLLFGGSCFPKFCVTSVSFHCFDFLGVQCKYPKAVSMWKESYEIWEQFSALEPQRYIFTNFLLQGSLDSILSLSLFFFLLHLTVTINCRVCLRPCEAMEKKGNKILKMHEP